MPNHSSLKNLDAGSNRTCAVVTMARNESDFLPVWIRHYAEQVGQDNIYVLDHRSDDGSTRDLPCRVLRLTRGAYSEEWKRGVFNRLHPVLLRHYDAVLVADADEFVVANPDRYRTIADYVARTAHPVSRAVGWDVVHDRTTEPALRWDTPPLLSQRRHWLRNTYLDKPALVRRPVTWAVGTHYLEFETTPEPDPDLWLVHLHWVDQDRLLKRHAFYRGIAWDPEDLKRGLGLHNRVPLPQIDAHFGFLADLIAGKRRPSDGGDHLGTPEEIPERLRQML